MFRPQVVILSFCSECGALLHPREPICSNCGEDCTERPKRLEGNFSKSEADRLGILNFGDTPDEVG